MLIPDAIRLLNAVGRVRVGRECYRARIGPTRFLFRDVRGRVTDLYTRRVGSESYLEADNLRDAVRDALVRGRTLTVEGESGLLLTVHVEHHGPLLEEREAQFWVMSPDGECSLTDSFFDADAVSRAESVFAGQSLAERSVLDWLMGRGGNVANFLNRHR